MTEKRNVRANESRSNIREEEARPQTALFRERKLLTMSSSVCEKAGILALLTL